MKQEIVKHPLALIAALAMLSACGGSGTVALTIWGEEFAEDKIPALSDDEEYGFADGWSVSFSKFVVSIGDIRLGGAEGEEEVSDKTFRVFELAPRGKDRDETGPVSVVDLEVAAARWNEVAYTIAPASDAKNVNADEADFKRLRDEGLSALLAGTATSADGERVIEFEWPFSSATEYSSCSHEDYGDGVSVARDERVQVELTQHVDHIFVDHLHSADASLRFDAIADADEDEDGKVSLEELAKMDLDDIADGDPDLYGTGGVEGVSNLRDFVEIQLRSVGHFRGEGHCHLKFLD